MALTARAGPSAAKRLFTRARNDDEVAGHNLGRRRFASLWYAGHDFVRPSDRVPPFGDLELNGFDLRSLESIVVVDGTLNRCAQLEGPLGSERRSDVDGSVNNLVQLQAA